MNLNSLEIVKNKAIIVLLYLLFFFFSGFSQIDKYSLLGIPTATFVEITAITDAQEGAMAYADDREELLIFKNSGWESLEITSTLESDTNGILTYTDETGVTTSFIPSVASATTISIDQSFMAKASVTGDINQPNEILTLTSQRTDTGWSINANEAIFNGTADYVQINAMAYVQQNENGGFARINPELELLKNGVVVARSATGYQRHVNGHDSSSNAIVYIDPSPAAGTTYQLRGQQGADQNDVFNIDLGHFDLIAVTKVTVLQTVTN